MNAFICYEGQAKTQAISTDMFTNVFNNENVPPKKL